MSPPVVTINNSGAGHLALLNRHVSAACKWGFTLSDMKDHIDMLSLQRNRAISVQSISCGVASIWNARCLAYCHLGKSTEVFKWGVQWYGGSHVIVDELIIAGKDDMDQDKVRCAVMKHVSDNNITFKPKNIQFKMLGVSPMCLILIRHYYFIERQCVNYCSNEIIGFLHVMGSTPTTNAWKGPLKTKKPSIWQYCRNDNLRCKVVKMAIFVFSGMDKTYCCSQFYCLSQA